MISCLSQSPVPLPSPAPASVCSVSNGDSFLKHDVTSKNCKQFIFTHSAASVGETGEGGGEAGTQHESVHVWIRAPIRPRPGSPRLETNVRTGTRMSSTSWFPHKTTKTSQDSLISHMLTIIVCVAGETPR